MGYSLDDKRDKMEGSDIPDIVESWNAFHRHPEQSEGSDRKAKHFFVPVEEIRENGYDLSINRYKEIVYEEIEYDTPEEIINGKDDELGIRQLTEERLKLVNELEEMIK